MDRLILNAKTVSRRWLLSSTVKLTAATYFTTTVGEISPVVSATDIGGATTATSNSAMLRAGGNSMPAPVDRSAPYAQTMGITTSDGWLIMPPLKSDGIARRIFVDAVNGNDNYNGFSPYAGKRGDGIGDLNQIRATGQGQSDGAYGPKKTLAAAFAVLPKRNWIRLDHGVGHRIMLAEGGTYQDPGANADGLKAVDHYGESISSPFAVHSYKPTDPWSNDTYGRATGNLRPIIKLSLEKQLSWGSLVDGSYGLIGNFIYAGLAFWGPNARIEEGLNFRFSSTDAENILIENCDFGALRFVEENQSGNKGTAHWSKNLVIRRTLFDHGFDKTGRQPGVFLAYVLGTYIEDCVFNHCTWADDLVGRYLEAGRGGADVFRHDVYNSGAGQVPLVYRRNVSVDPAATALSNRNNSIAYNNWIIDAPIGLISAGNVQNGLSIEQPNGNYFNHHHNFFMGSAMMNAPRLIFNSQPIPGNTIARIANIEYEFVNPGQAVILGREPIIIGSTLSATIENFIKVLNAKTDSLNARVNYWNFSEAEIRQAPKKQGGAFVWVEGYGAGIGVPDPLFRCWGYAATNGVSESSMSDSLLVNSGFSQNTGNAPNAHGLYVDRGRSGATSYVQFHRNHLYDFGPSRENVRVEGTEITYEGNTYSLTSPHTNEDVYFALGFAVKETFIAALVARFEEPWAARGLQAGHDLWGHDFTVPLLTPPVILVQPSVDKTAPTIGDVLSFNLPQHDGVMVSATTYVDMHPVPNTGKAQNTLVVTSEHQGKRISRIWVIASLTGGLPTSVLYELPNVVAGGRMGISTPSSL